MRQHMPQIWQSLFEQAEDLVRTLKYQIESARSIAAKVNVP
jgi:hypothetical protein